MAAESRPSPWSLFPIRSVWKLALNNRLVAPPAVDNGRVFFPLEGNRLVAYELATGEQRWLMPAQVAFAPVAGEGLLFVVEPESLAALRQTDGSTAWRVPFDAPLAVPLAWDNGWLLAADASGRVTGLRAADGRAVWHRELGARATAPPALSQDRVYVPAEDRRIVALHVETGEPIWERRLGGPPSAILALEDRLYVGSTDNFLYCISAAKGEIAWRWRTGGDVIGAPVVDDHRVYFVSLDNILRALDRRTGNQAWKRPLPVRPITGPERVVDAVIVAGLAPTVRAFRLGDGAPAGDIPAPGELAAPPTVVSADGLSAPFVLIVTQEMGQGALATLVTRSLDPPIVPLAPLPTPTVQPVSPGALTPPPDR